MLIRGGAGGVGLFAVQLAAHLGAEVIATAQDPDAELVREMGAERVISYRDTHSLIRVNADVLVDAVGGAFPDALYPALHRGGRLVTLSQPPDHEQARRFGVEADFFVVVPDRTQLAGLAELVDTGALRPVVARRFPLAQGRLAYEKNGTRRAPGKIVLQVRAAATSSEKKAFT